MTEGAPVTHVGRLKSTLEGAPTDQRYAKKAKQGLLAPGLDMKVVDAEGNEVPWDGRSMGEMALRGPWIADAYYDDGRTAETFRDGWYYTGDVVTVDPDGTCRSSTG
ncbi:MAG: hypothetical protein A6D92_20920 [Symbiobacterium thermophilum]|uniref:AMP-dependent synthetase/ligase domain-containing protein n=1 Tax=Symbiobacterium thermophilum TaxID=2734 RepID=A0A1Y2T1M4_SYMTR|nr:MAG: hypothetical protein A6D92_20920 [Symbiobacterium thermophilum]